MKPLPRTISLAVVSLVAITASSCRQMQVQNRLDEYKAMLEPMVGMTAEQVLDQMGPPTSTQDLGEGLKVWVYYRSHGHVGTVYVSPGQYAAVGTGAQWESYDKVQLTFKHGQLTNWDAYVQR